MRWDRQKKWAAAGVAALALGLFAGQSASGQGPQGQTALQEEIVAELQGMSRRAATVFVGQITSIQHRGSVVEVRFRVERPVQGYTGATYVLREWGGAWVPGQSRYRVGQRALAFVHGSSAAGFSSPVHGAEGLVPVAVQGANAPMLLDVRRVAASVVRPVGTPLPSPGESLLPLDAVLTQVYPGGRKLRAPANDMRLPPAGGRQLTTFHPVVSGGAETAASRSRIGASALRPIAPAEADSALR